MQHCEKSSLKLSPLSMVWLPLGILLLRMALLRVRFSSLAFYLAGSMKSRFWGLTWQKATLFFW